MITVATLIAAGISPSMARIFAAPIADACTAYEIDSPVRQAHFVGQCGTESRGFSDLEESMFYRDAAHIRQTFSREVESLAVAQTLVANPKGLANLVYANRGGNGDVASGDGYKFIGRGLIDITFRSAYRDCGYALNLPLTDQPDLLLDPANAALSAGWYWAQNHINALADTDDVESVTRRINPALMGIDDRKRRTALAMEAFV